MAMGAREGLEINLTLCPWLYYWDCGNSRGNLGMMADFLFDFHSVDVVAAIRIALQ